MVVLTAVYVALTAAYVQFSGRTLNAILRQEKSSADQFTKQISSLTKSANAMENIATVIQSGNAAVMRAYLSVVIGGASYQERQDGVRFEAKPLLVNTGSTPARNLRIWISADIVPVEKAETFDYPAAKELAKVPAVAAPHQNYNLSAIVPNFVPDAHVHIIKQGQGIGELTVWGVVTYEDIFGERHTTKFGQWLFRYPNNSVYGYFIPGQNDMD